MEEAAPMTLPDQVEPDLEPERFDPALLAQPPAARVAWFEKECTIEHLSLVQARDGVLRTICSPGEGPSLNRLGTMVLVIGPSRVGKTTLIRLLEQELIARAGERLLREPAHRPFVSISATGPGSGRFDWVDYYTAVLRQVNNPFLDRKPSAIRVRDLREAMEEALVQHHPYAVIVDEAHHLAKAASGRTLQDQLDHLKDLENRTGVCHVLVGTYEMRRFRTVTPQLAGRSVDVHFRRYDATKKEEREEFRSVLWALQRQLPVEVEPVLAEQHWEMLYARSIGCIGLLKLHLIRALALALTEHAQTITETHLRATAPPEDRVKEMLGAALAGEEDLTEPEGADERLLELLGLREKTTVPLKSSENKQDHPVPTPSSNRKPGDRNPGRDAIGEGFESEDRDSQGERAAG
jgi:energy-coupling factor transporter ATP-binding protein EcfA2